jgi:hypothetical protein
MKTFKSVLTWVSLLFFLKFIINYMLLSVHFTESCVETYFKQNCQMVTLSLKCSRLRRLEKLLCLKA